MHSLLQNVSLNKYLNFCVDLKTMWKLNAEGEDNMTLNISGTITRL